MVWRISRGKERKVVGTLGSLTVGGSVGLDFACVIWIMETRGSYACSTSKSGENEVVRGLLTGCRSSGVLSMLGENGDIVDCISYVARGPSLS